MLKTKTADKHFKNYFNALPQPAIIVKGDGLSIIASNQAAMDLYEFSAAEFQECSFNDILHIDHLSYDEFSERYTDHTVKEEHCKKNGEVFFAEVKVSAASKSSLNEFIVLINPLSAEKKLNFQMQVLSQITEAVIIISMEGRITSWNNGAKQIYGYTAAEALGRSARDVFGLHDIEYNERVIDRQVMTYGEWKTVDIHRTKEGKKIFAESITRLMRNEKDELSGIIILVRDITEKMRAEEQLRRSKEELNVILRSVSDGIIAADENNKIVYANKAAAEMFGFSSYKDLVNRRPEVILDEYDLFREDGTLLSKNMFPGRIAMSGAEAASTEFRYVHKTTGKEGWTQIVSNPVYNETNKIRLIVNVLRDITEQKKAEKEIKLSEMRFRLLFEQSPFSTQLLSPSGCTLRVNKAWENLFGYGLDDVAKVNYFETKELLEIGAANLARRAVDEGPLISDPVKYVCCRGKYKGKVIWFKLHVYPVKDSVTGGTKEIVLIYENYTERKSAIEKFVREFNIRQGIENAIPEGIALVELDGKQSYVNPAFCRMVGWTEEELIDKYPPFVYWDKNEYEKISKAFELTIKGQAPVNGFGLKFVKKDGSKIDVQLLISPMEDSENNITGWLSSVSDITERKMQEEILRKSEEKYRKLVEGTNALLFATDTRGYFTYVNEAASAALGLPINKLVGHFYLRYVHPADRMYVHNTFARWMRERPGSGYVEFRYINDKLKEGWISFVVSPVYENGEPAGMYGIAQDITERKLAEEKIAASLKEKEILLKEVHHRVKNNMQIIYSLLNLQTSSINDSGIIDVFRESQNRIRTMALIHEKLYQSKELSKIDLPGYFKELVNFLLSSYSIESTNIDVNFSTADAEVNMDTAISLGLILNELVSNSLKYAFTGRQTGTLTIELKTEASGYRLVVGDDGRGLPENLNFMNASSLGLQLVNTLVEQLNGRIKLENHKGVRYIINFPQAAGS